MKYLRELGIAGLMAASALACSPEQTTQGTDEETGTRYTIEDETVTAQLGELETILQGNFHQFLNPPKDVNGMYRIKVKNEGNECYIPEGDWNENSAKRYEETPKCTQEISDRAKKALKAALTDTLAESYR